MTRKANNVQEARAIMSELDRTIKRYAEITGEDPPTDYIQAIIERILDSNTMQYMVGYDVDGEVDSKAYRDRVTTYLSTMCFNDGSKKMDNAMDLDNVETQLGEQPKSEGEPAEEPGEEWLNAFQGNCWNCGGYGHFARECGIGNGGQKGGTAFGKGKGEAKGYQTGGQYFKGGGKGGKGKGE